MDYSGLAKGHLDVVVKDRIAVATMNRPDRLNAMGGGLHEALEEFIALVNHDPDINVVILTGAGRAFCAGGDVQEMNERATGQATARDPGWQLRGPKTMVQRFVDCQVPIVAAINGHAVGLGATIALLCDVTYMADTAKIGDTHVKVGLSAGDGGSMIWPLLIGPNRAKELLFSGRLLTGVEAEKMGVVNHCVPAANLMSEAMAYAKELANGSRWALRYTKLCINKYLVHGTNMIVDFGLLSENLLMATEDHKEATTAFKEKRAPKFTGR